MDKKNDIGKTITLDADVVNNDTKKEEKSLKKGLVGIITSIDDTGQIHVDWKNEEGKTISTLAVSKEYGDKFTITETKKIKGFKSFVNEGINTLVALNNMRKHQMEREKNKNIPKPYNENTKSKIIFIQDNMEMVGDKELDAMIKLIMDNVSSDKLIDNEL